jgi:hypothetical protein
MRSFAGSALGWADTVSHWPGVRRVVPAAVQRWLCDVMDWSLGEDWAELRRTSRERMSR